MQTRANAEIVVYSGKSQDQVDRDSRYKIDKQKNGQKQSPSPIRKIKVQKGQARIVNRNRAEVKNQESDVRINQGTRQTRKTKRVSIQESQINWLTDNRHR